MAESIMLEKAKDFAVNIVNLCKHIKETKREAVLTNQLLRAGTSIGANIHESKYAHGTADFIAKMQIALKECQESFRNISAPSPDPLPKPQFLRKAVGLNYGKKEYIINIAFVLPKYENSWYND